MSGSDPHSAAGECFMLGQEPHRFQRRHAAHAGGGDRLAVDVVGDVAGGVDARDRWSRCVPGVTCR